MTIQSPDLAESRRATRTTYLAELLSLRSNLTVPSVEWLKQGRDRATVQLQGRSLPSTRDEEWRFTDLSPLLSVRFTADTSDAATVGLAEVEPFVLPEVGDRLVFINGVYAPSLSSKSARLDGFVGSLTEALQTATLAEKLQPYFNQPSGADETFTLLNTASFTDAAVVWVAKNQTMDAPLHLLFLSLSGSEPLVSHPRCIVVADRGSRLTLVEEYATLGASDNGQPNLSNAVTDVWVDEDAQVHHTRIQRDGVAAFHIGKTSVSQARTSRYTCNAISLGAALSRHNLEIHQTGEQTETTLNGLTRIGGEQVADTHSAIALTKPYATTRQLHKCIIDDRAHGIFNGKVLVPKAAQQTDAGQLNRNLLLSPKARVDTKPQLEIVADNVKCTHGATVGQLDADEVFYLQSRGIDAANARNLLVYAFAYEIINQVPVDSLRRTLARLVTPQPPE